MKLNIPTPSLEQGNKVYLFLQKYGLQKLVDKTLILGHKIKEISSLINGTAQKVKSNLFLYGKPFLNEEQKEKRERILDENANLFRIGEAILEKYPNIQEEEFIEKFTQAAHENEISPNEIQKKIIQLSGKQLTKIQNNFTHEIDDFFHAAQIKKPETLTEQEEIMNTNPEIQFLAWKNIFNGGIENRKFQKILKENREIENDEEYEEIIKEFWRASGGVGLVKFDLVQKPDLIIQTYSHDIKPNSKESAHYQKEQNSIFIQKESEKRKQALDHEYKHFLHHCFTKPIREQILSFYQLNGVKHKQQWEEMQDELLAYMEGSGELMEGFYFPHSVKLLMNMKSQTQNFSKQNFKQAYSIISILQSLIDKGIPVNQLSNIIRTSHGMDEFFDRLKTHYKDIYPFAPSIFEQFDFQRNKQINQFIENQKKASSREITPLLEEYYDNMEYRMILEGIHFETEIHEGTLIISFQAYLNERIFTVIKKAEIGKSLPLLKSNILAVMKIIDQFRNLENVSTYQTFKLLTEYFGELKFGENFTTDKQSNLYYKNKKIPFKNHRKGIMDFLTLTEEEFMEEYNFDNLLSK